MVQNIFYSPIFFLIYMVQNSKNKTLFTVKHLHSLFPSHTAPLLEAASGPVSYVSCPGFYTTQASRMVLNALHMYLLNG